ncbi:MAG: hypothetical protein OXL41_11940 [Nitrospinae bacterium]|nr:hypothetical protein [Nitrospinota bacterium]
MSESLYPLTPSEIAHVYRQIPAWSMGELIDLSEEQLDRTGMEEWARWSPRRQLSHMAYITTRWFMVLYGATGLPWPVVDMSQFATFINTRDDDRRFSSKRYGDIEWLHLRFSEACEAAANQVEKLANEDSANKSLLFVFTDSSVVGVSEERSVDLWSRCMKCHPDGFTIDPEHGHGFRITPLATLRHVLWDDLIHLRSIRLHREALGLSPVYPDAPVGGYTTAYPIY